jgi:hypothetical protein
LGFERTGHSDSIYPPSINIRSFKAGKTHLSKPT